MVGVSTSLTCAKVVLGISLLASAAIDAAISVPPMTNKPMITLFGVVSEFPELLVGFVLISSPFFMYYKLNCNKLIIIMQCIFFNSNCQLLALSINYCQNVRDLTTSSCSSALILT